MGRKNKQPMDSQDSTASTSTKKPKLTQVIGEAMATFANANKLMAETFKSALEASKSTSSSSATSQPGATTAAEVKSHTDLIKTHTDLIKTLTEKNGVSSSSSSSMAGAKHPTQSIGHVVGEATSGISANDEGN